eukprot:TRINITY_DN756_c0_g1_i2.p1 TRINITY_DN756_c0_g1~~TRINITY_DN756_c0_g1_i2.p1  ORF type:complete len:511 (+),score=167.07 TRINITY_DN756_c0_g1_i2:320-1852(+)
MLGLSDKRWRATQDDIRKSYRKLVLEHHPDKNKQRDGKDDDDMFKSIQKAWEILSDPVKRKVYDSQEPFDDSIPDPEDITSDRDFYREFGDAFSRYAKWSVKKKIPSLGNPDTPLPQVEQFYQFWRFFDSWRTFDYLNEYDLKEAESREERRWMERRNQKLQKKKKMEENQRIKKLVDTAYSLDPRILKRKREEKAEKERKQKEREEAARKRKEDEEKKAEEIRKKREEEEKAKAAQIALEKKEQQKLKEALKKRRIRLRKLGDQNKIDALKIDTLCSYLNLERLTQICETPATSLKDVVEQEYEKFEQEKKKKEQELYDAASSKSKPKIVEDKEDASWTTEELALLTKAIVRFPGGVSGRWQQIQGYLGGSKTIKQIVAKVKKLKTDELASVSQTRELEDSFERYKKEKRAPKLDVQSDLSQNYEGLAKTDDNPPPSTTTTQPPTATIAPPVNWSKEDQKALEIALKKFGAKEPERWDKIAAAVPGKTKKECLQRYKYIVSIVKTKSKK